MTTTDSLIGRVAPWLKNVDSSRRGDNDLQMRPGT
jgi:hypothetical protein